MNWLKEIKSFALLVFAFGFLFSASLSSCENKAKEKETVSTEKSATENAKKADHPQGEGEHPKGEGEHPKGEKGKEHPKK